MIRIAKRAAPPTVLVTRGVPAAQTHCAAYDLAPDDYRSGAVTFSDADFDRTIYAAEDVKEALREDQHRKCAFCESFFDHIAYGDVEHFRPKGGYRQRDHDALRRPGYYWLVYEWTNLFFSCQLCNQRFKRNLFPLRDNRSRARSHRYNLANEEPLLIDPTAHDPSGYVSFRGEYAIAVNGCREGDTTIEVLGLNREELIEIRRDRLAQLERLVWLRDLLSEKLATTSDPESSRRLSAVEATLQASREDSGQYAAMARAFLA
jgi:uncharacterized protein (TIGR02646 family)